MAQTDTFASLEWLFSQRRELQGFLTTLKTHFSEMDVRESLSARVLLAIGYSLWRALYLADLDSQMAGVEHAAQGTDKSVFHAHTERFLDVLIRESSIGYMPDKENKIWGFGYYLFNAMLRLNFLYRHMGVHGENVRCVEGFIGAHAPCVSSSNAEVAWECAFDAAKELLAQHLQQSKAGL